MKRARRKLMPLSEEARSLRTPVSPDRFMGALQDRVHADQGRVLAAKPMPGARGR